MRRWKRIGGVGEWSYVTYDLPPEQQQPTGTSEGPTYVTYDLPPEPAAALPVFPPIAEIYRATVTGMPGSPEMAGAEQAAQYIMAAMVSAFEGTSPSTAMLEALTQDEVIAARWAAQVLNDNPNFPKKSDLMKFLDAVAPYAVAAIIGVAAAGVVSGALAPSASAAAGGAGTASVSGAELAALVEAGTVGAEGAFLEAAALSGASVSYSTATGALLEATLPSGASIAFDPAADAFAQFGIEPSQMALPEAAPEIAASEVAPEPVSEAAIEETAIAEVEGQIAPGTLENMIGADAAGYLEAAADALAVKALQAGEQKLAQEIQQALVGAVTPGGTSASSAGSMYRPTGAGIPPGDLDLELQAGALPSGGISGTLAGAAKPALLGAGIGLLGLLLLGAGEDN